MNRLYFLILLLAGGVAAAQNDVDAIRYSRAGVGGTSRSLGVGGAFGAVGADLSAGAFNPAGLALFRKGEFSFSGGLKYGNNSATLYNRSSNTPDLRFVFNNFGFVLAWPTQRDPDSRHALAFASTQVQNFNSSVRMAGYTNNSSIAKDMRDLANEAGTVGFLSPAYEYLGFNSFLLDTIDGQFISLLDTRRTVRQVRDLDRSGKQNDMNFSYAYSYKDQYYIGVSLGIPRVDYRSTTTHYEYDDNDSIWIHFNPDNSYTHSFIGGLPALNSEYLDKGAFSSLEYIEYFRTVGTGFNLKLGGIARVNKMLRLGLYYHTPTFYNLTDLYENQMYVYFDQDPGTAYESMYPSGGTGRFEYKVITPSRFSVNTAVLFGKRALVAVDYEMVNYRRAQLRSKLVSDFADLNSMISEKYGLGHNLKLGAELNFSPFMLRAGYAMLGSPFGETFSGEFVRQQFSVGAGIRPQGNFYLDFVLVASATSENYFLFTTLDAMSKLSLQYNMLGVTAGFRF